MEFQVDFWVSDSGSWPNLATVAVWRRGLRAEIEPNSATRDGNSKKARDKDLRERYQWVRDQKESFSEANRFEACFLFLGKVLKADCWGMFTEGNLGQSSF